MKKIISLTLAAALLLSLAACGSGTKTAPPSVEAAAVEGVADAQRTYNPEFYQTTEPNADVPPLALEPEIKQAVLSLMDGALTDYGITDCFVPVVYFYMGSHFGSLDYIAPIQIQDTDRYSIASIAHLCAAAASVSTGDIEAQLSAPLPDDVNIIVRIASDQTGLYWLNEREPGHFSLSTGLLTVFFDKLTWDEIDAQFGDVYE